MRKFTLKVFTSKGSEFEPLTFRAPKGQEFTGLGVQLMIAKYMAELERQYPGEIFRVVRTGKAQFNVLPQATAHA